MDVNKINLYKIIISVDGASDIVIGELWDEIDSFIENNTGLENFEISINPLDGTKTFRLRSVNYDRN